MTVTKCLSAKISVSIRKKFHEVMRVISNQSLIITRSVQSDRRYYQYNNESANEMILPLFPTYLCYCELWQHFPPVLFMYPHKKKSHGNSLESKSTPHTSPYTNTTPMYSLFENKRVIFTKF
jgi:hypothetical protein